MVIANLETRCGGVFWLSLTWTRRRLRSVFACMSSWVYYLLEFEYLIQPESNTIDMTVSSRVAGVR